MRAAVFEGPGQIALREVPVPAPARGQVLVRLQGGGICASELPSWQGREWLSYPLPAGTPGHEGWGEVVAVGEGVLEPGVGTRVAIICSRAHAEHACVPREHAVALPEALDPGLPFPGEPLACAINAFRRARVQAGDRVALVGGGFLGLLLAQLCADIDSEVTVISRRACARQAALRCGAACALPVAEAEDCEPFDVVIEATGHQVPLDLATRLVRVRGRLVIAGYHQDGPRTVDMQLWNWRGIDVINAHERDPAVYVRGLRKAVRAVQIGILRPAPLVTHAFPLARIADAYAVADERPEGFIKAVWCDG